MKFSTVFTAAVVAVVCLLQPSAAEEQASVHLRVHTVEQSPNGAICYKACPSGQYCPRGENACRKPTGNQCFNPATSLFRNGCDPGFKCDNGKCVYKCEVVFQSFARQARKRILLASVDPDLSCVDGGSSLSFPNSPLKQQASKSPETMKFSTFFTATFIAAACLFQSTTAEDQASVHLRVHNVEQSNNGAICYKACPSGQYCPRGETECRAPSNNQCFNPATSLFISACDPGFKCDNGKCVYA